MTRFHRRHTGMLILLGLCGCPERITYDGVASPSSSASTASTAASSSDADSPCEPGTLYCECRPNDVCDGDLVCTPQGCEDFGPSETSATDDTSAPPPPTTGLDPTNPDPTNPDPTDATDPDTGPTDESTGEPPSCVTHEDCGSPLLVCLSDGSCEFAILARYLVRVTSWTPFDCSGGLADGDADLWWGLYLDNDLVTTSGWVPGGCPGAWDHSFCVEGGGPGVGFATPFRLRLYDEDNTSSELHDELWWDYGDGAPGVIPEQYLLAGEYSGPTNWSGEVNIEFILEGC